MPMFRIESTDRRNAFGFTPDRTTACMLNKQSHNITHERTVSISRLISSFEAISMTDTEISFEPTNLSDLTIHMKDHSFHVHTQIMSLASNYFNSAIQALKSDECSSCTRSEQCKASGHLCLTLPDLIGGTDYRSEDMHKFLSALYDPSFAVTASDCQLTPFEVSIDFTHCSDLHSARVKGNTLSASFVANPSVNIVIQSNQQKLYHHYL
jgi:hypothetical protein